MWLQTVETMSNRTAFDYEAMIQKALRDVVRDVLTETAKNGLPSPHHFYITFATNHPWVEMPDYLYSEYPQEMVIVLQYEFKDLEVTNDRFSVTLCFDDQDERITVPFMALISFIDPSVQFGLQFMPGYDPNPEEDDPSPQPPSAGRSNRLETKANVISLDDFRKK